MSLSHYGEVLLVPVDELALQVVLEDAVLDAPGRVLGLAHPADDGVVLLPQLVVLEPAVEAGVVVPLQGNGVDNNSRCSAYFAKKTSFPIYLPPPLHDTWTRT